MMSLFSMYMDRIRHILAVVAFVIYGPDLLFWFLIHPFVRFWRRLGPVITYVIVFAVLNMIGVAALQIRETLVGRNFGTNWNLIVLGTILFGISLVGWESFTAFS